MKKFNLDAALNGEPVMLRNGKKAIIYYCTPAEFKFDENIPDSFPLKGRVFDEKGYLEDPLVTWRCNGRFRYSEDDWDIIGMWEEPKKQTKKQISIEDLPKPFKPKKDEEYFYLGCKTVYSKRYCDDFDHDLSEGGQCFRTEQDAQKWLDFMKSMME